MFGKILKSLVYASRGLETAWKEEHNFRLEAVVSVLVLALAYFYQLNYLEFALVIIAVVLVLGAEILNTAVEDLCNKVEPNRDNVIGKIKDLMAAFVLVVSIGAVFLATIAFLHHFTGAAPAEIFSVCVPSSA